MAPSKSPKIHVIDFEGNALEGIFEYGIVSLDGLEIAAATTRFCFVDRPVSILRRQEKNRRQDCIGTRPFEADFDRFHGSRQDGIFAAHNASCEDYLLRKTWATPGFVPNFLDASQPTALWGPWIDTAVLHRKFEPNRPSYQLQRLIAEDGLGTDLAQLAKRFCPPGRRKFHCALFDALAAALLLIRLMARHGLDARSALRHSLSQQKFQQFTQMPLL